MKTTKKRLKYLIKNEIKAAKEYTKRGFKSLAKDERKHSKFLKRKLKKSFSWKMSV